MEEYKNVFEDYEVSNLGNIRRLMKNGNYREIKGSIMNRGYRYLQLQRSGKRCNHLVHHLVAKAFIGDRPEGLVIDHKDQNKLNNNVDNLHYVTQAENCRNMNRYRSDIEPTDRATRQRIHAQNSAKKIRKSKKYYCNLCEHAFKGPKALVTHQNGAHHKLRQMCCDEIGDDWKNQYRIWKSRRNDQKRRNKNNSDSQ